MHRRAAALAVPLTAIALVVSSCGSIPEDWKTPAFLRMNAEELDPRLPDVTGEVGEEPEITFPDNEPPEEEISGIVSKGSGEDVLVGAEDLVVANVVQYQWTGPGEGEAMEGQSSYASGAPDLVRMNEMPEYITETLVSQPLGSRAVYVFPPLSQEEIEQAQAMGQEAPEGASVLVIDLMDRYSQGAVVPGEQTDDGGGDLPTVTQDGHSRPEIDIPEGDAPEDLEVAPLIEGEGAEVEDGQQVIVQYTGVRWDAEENGSHEVFDSTWDRGGAPFDTTIGGGAVIEGWDEGIVGANVGDRLMLVVPGSMAYGETEEEAMGGPVGTLVFVVDVLGAYDNPPPPEPEETEGEGADEEASDPEAEDPEADTEE
ncbi:FKBP-type peptidyl-prolyl cis-trans isomerase [Nocardiopsis sp. MG754419]|uniref:FKBP-type peptidyl-prolyl cis-trans isomerase n=1 Tax=Nocardiopsis sp. MG754419 TaxID=2259865 RepID=UPI001BAA425A|nr:FKBP-type peptidyl-prolyl cis-trans isomerase [Nocardiopsis sp. MG754419]MBR8742143.1 FKBP-type peptidyl-prolyl cis-trans isomerase [Nocardiopsis sp. MG754419]